jgi:hypothetical protein
MRLLSLGIFIENFRVCDVPQVVIPVNVDEFLIYVGVKVHGRRT